MHKRPPRRLPGVSYVGCLAISLRFCTSLRRRVFVGADAVDPVLLQFLRASGQCRVAVVAYCFMPDHVHLLVEGLRPDSDLRRFISLAKQYSGFDFQARFGERLWQRYGYERVLRSAEAIDDVARYILENPVRAGLVERAIDYPFSGSCTCDVRVLLGSLGAQSGTAG